MAASGQGASDSQTDRRKAPADGLATCSRLLREGRVEAALALGDSLLASFPDDADVLRCLGLGHLRRRQPAEAERYLVQALRSNPSSPDLLNDLAIARLKQGARDEALRLFNAALAVDPNHRDALGNLASVLTESRQPGKARPYLDRLVELMPFSGAAHTKAARNSLAVGEPDEAIRRGRKAVRLSPQSAEARLALAEALESTGRFQQARFQYLAVLRREPRHARALANLLSQRSGNPDERHLRAAEELLQGAALGTALRAQLHLALARCLDRDHRFDDAILHLRRGNALASREDPFDAVSYSRAVDAIIEAFTPELLRSGAGRGNASRRPIFIVGMPRSGTTLIEQVLASHSQVIAGGELSAITNLAAALVREGERYPSCVKGLSGTELAALAEEYLRALDAIAPGALRVTDKMPFNFMHVGLIALLFPKAAIIHCRRAPLDTCVSCLFTSFSRDLLFATDLEALGRYYLDYHRLMGHWRQALPARFLDVDYERMVGAPEATIRSLLDWCGLEWEPQCLEFHRTQRSVRTPSRWQVRQPIYTHSIGRWRRYEKHLGRLQDILAEIPVESDGAHRRSIGS